MKQSTMQMMKIGTLAKLAIGGAVFATVALPTHRVAADDETHDTEIRITAPIDSTSCGATPSTITVLGLSIDVSSARFDATASSSAAPSPTPAATAGDDGTKTHGGRVSGGSPTSTCYYYCPPSVPTPSAGCAALVAGQTVEVKVKADGASLTATEVGQKTGAANVEVQAPIQTIDATLKQITILGLTVDVSGAGLDGSDDKDETSQPIDLSELVSGQFVEVQLVSSVPPLVATELDVKNFANQIEVSIEDRDGHPIDDVDGNETVSVSSTAPTPVPTPPTYYGVPIGLPPAVATPARERKQLHLHGSSHGRVTVSGLPTGRATILVKRSHGGIVTVARRNVVVRSNSSRSVHLQLQRAFSR
jgi:hypothetical protein